MKKKKLMILIWNMGIGGVQVLLRDLIMYIDRTHPEIEVYLLIQQKKESPLLLEIRQKTQVTIRCQGKKHESFLIKQVYFFYWIVRQYISIHPDIFLTFNDYLSCIVILVKKIVFWCNCKVVINENIVTSGSHKINRNLVWFWKLLVMGIYQYADKVIVPTRACKDDLTNEFHILANKITIVSNWTLLDSTVWTDKKYDLIYVGRLEKEKNLEVLIDLINKLREFSPRISLCLVGTGKEESKLKAKIVGLKLIDNVSMLGFQANIIPYMQKSKIFVMTTRNEGMPVSLLEAASCGLPSVVNRFIGVDEIIRNGATGYIVDSLDTMSNKIKELLLNDALRKRLGIEAHKYVKSCFGQKNLQCFAKAVLSPQEQ